MLTPLLLIVALDSAPRVQVKPSTELTRVEVIATLAGPLLAKVPQGQITQEQGETWLRFCLVDAETRKEGPPIFGSYRRKDASLLFVPRHPLAYGQLYRATLIDGDGKSIRSDHRVPARPETPAAFVENIYPTTEVLPANHLKFYIHFSRPMRESRTLFDQIQMVDEKGKPVADPWRRTELWNRDCTRLTLWIHPGRIKMGVGPREGEGPVLEANKKYSLVIGKEVVDAAGQALGKPFTKTFRTTAEDRTRPLPEQWKLTTPKKGTREPLLVEFPETLDRPLLDHFLTIKDNDDEIVTGRIEVGKEEKSWSFHPEKPWASGEHQLLVDEALEDLAGNTPLRLFDVNLQEPAPKPPALTLRFKPRT